MDSLFFMIEVSKGGQGGTPLPTTSLQTKSESVIVGYTHSKECCVMASPPAEKRRAKMAKNQQGRYELCKGKTIHRF